MIVKFQIIVISNTVVSSNISWLFNETVKFWILIDVWVMVDSGVIRTVAKYSLVLYKIHLKISFIINIYIHLIVNKLYEKPTKMWYIPYISKILFFFLLIWNFKAKMKHIISTDIWFLYWIEHNHDIFNFLC